MQRLAPLFSPFALGLLAGCVSSQHIALAPGSADSLRGREITLAARDKPDFAAGSPGKAAFGLVGAALMIESGNKIVASHNIEDPALQIAQTLAAELARNFQARSSASAARIATDDAAQIARENAALDLMLDVRTIHWSFVYFPTAWNRYRVVYSARLRLIDIKRSQVIAEGLCSRNPEQTANAPTSEQLLANGAARLKSELKTAADFCIEHFRTATFAFAGKSAPVAAAPAAAPATSAPPAPSVAAEPVASVAPMPAVVSSTRYPQPGDTWTYRLTELPIGARPEPRDYVVQVVSGSEANVRDEVSPGGAAGGEWVHSRGGYLFTQGVPLFSPYLAVFQDLTPGTALGRVTEDEACVGWYTCYSQARIVGREPVQVPAGRFDAIKVIVEQRWSSRPGIASGGGRRTLTIWYSPQAKRAVKFSNRASGTSRLLLHTNFDLELVSYQLK